MAQVGRIGEGTSWMRWWGVRCRACGKENVDDAVACVACAQALRTPTQLVHPTPRATGPAPIDMGSEPKLSTDTTKNKSPTKRERSPSSLPSSARTEGGTPRADDEEARFAEGDVVLGTYVIERQLGKGGMGTVYLGRDDVSGQRVAIKVLPGALAREKDIRDRFIQEARSLAALDHPGIVPLITFAQDGDDRFLVMKYVGGRPLERLLDDDRVLDPVEARRIVREVVTALGYAHEKGVVHRDIKPANVLVDDAGRVVVVDFGIARKLESAKRLTQTGMLMGTPQYMSPEQIEGHAVDGRADLYACGLLLFEMLAGRPPFDAEKTFDILKAHVEKPVPDLRLLRKERAPDAAAVPDDLVALCHALLEKDPAKRPQTGRDVLDALDGRTSFAMPPPTEPELSPSRSLKTRTTTETPALAFSDARPLIDDDEPVEAPSNPALRWAAGFVVLCVLGAVYVVQFGNPLAEFMSNEDAVVVDAGVADAFEMGVLLSRARVAFEKGKFDDARVAVDTALHLDADNVEALLLRARILVGGNNKTAAKETLARLPKDLDAAAAAERTAIEELIEPKAKPKATVDDDRAEPKKKPKPKKEKPKKETEKEEASSTSSSAASSERARPNELPDDQLARITRVTRERLSNCYVEHVLVVDATAAGEVAVAVTIDADGSVAGVAVKKTPFASSEFNTCLIDAIKTWKFPAFDGEPDTLAHKFNFKPG